MQNLARDEAGNVWEVDAQGNAVRMVEPAAPAAQGRVFSLPQNPKEARQEQRQTAADARAEAAAARAAAAAERNAANDERRIRLAEEAAERDRIKSENDANGTATKRAEWRANLSNISQLEQTIANLRQQYDQNFKGKGLQSVAESYAPVGLAPQYGVFDDTAQSMLADMAKAKGLTAQQFNTPAEQRMFFEPLIPKRGDTDEQIEAKIANLERMVRAGRETTEVNLGTQQRADNEVPDPTTGAGLKPPAPGVVDDRMDKTTAYVDGPRAEARTTAAGGDTRVTFDPRMSSQIDSLINAGASKATVDAVLKKQNYPVVTPQEWTAIQTWRKQYPGQKYYGANISKEDELSLLQKAAGSETGSFIAHSGNALAAGIPAALAGPTGQGALDAMATANPRASLAGGVAGGVAGVAGAELAAARYAPQALAKYAPRIADTLYGGLTGFNSAQEGEGLEGAAMGAGAGLAGGYLGEKAMKAVGSGFRGLTDPAVGTLRAADVPLTVGQAVGNSGRMGSAVKKIEDALTSLPLVGNIIDARRMEGLRGFNQAAFREAGSPIGAAVDETGAAGLNQLRQEVGSAYDNALGPVRIDPTDPSFGAQLQDVIRAAEGIPNVNGAQDAAMTGLQSRIDGAIDPLTGDIPGRGFQEAYRGLARTGRERAKGDYGHEVGQVMRQGQDVLAGALEGQNPGAFSAFKAANSTNRNANVLAEAVNRARNAEDELFTPAQLNMVDTMSSRRLTGPLASASGERPFYDLATSGVDVLPSQLPDSGTATRALVGGGLTGVLGGGGAYLGGGEGAATGTGLGLGATLALALGGTKGSQSALIRMLADRPDVAIRLGNTLRDNAQIGGWSGAGVLTPLLVGQ